MVPQLPCLRCGSAASKEVQTGEAVETTLLDALPADLDFGGYEFHIAILEKQVSEYDLHGNRMTMPHG